MSTVTRNRLLAATILLAATAALARGDGPTTAPAAAPTTAPAAGGSLPYQLWAKFKPGSSATLSGDVAVPGMGQAHMDLTVTLTAVTPDAVTLGLAQKITVGGQTQTMPARTQTIQAGQAVQLHPAGTADVAALGKTFPCTIYETPMPGGRGSVKMYANPDVPGGTVQVEMPLPGGQSNKMVLTAMDAK